MKRFHRWFLWLIVGALFSGCSSTDESSQTSVGLYYGTGFYDPWYYGGYYEDIDIIVTPPDRPGDPVHPAHPIQPVPPPPVTPVQPIAPTPAPRPMPSIPRTPMPMPRVRMR